MNEEIRHRSRLFHWPTTWRGADAWAVLTFASLALFAGRSRALLIAREEREFTRRTTWRGADAWAVLTFAFLALFAGRSRALLIAREEREFTRRKGRGV